MCQRRQSFSDRATQSYGEVIDGEFVTAWLEWFGLLGCYELRFAGAKCSEQRGHRGVRLAIEHDVNRRQTLIVHAPAIVQSMVN